MKTVCAFNMADMSKYSYI